MEIILTATSSCLRHGASYERCHWYALSHIPSRSPHEVSQRQATQALHMLGANLQMHGKPLCAASKDQQGMNTLALLLGSFFPRSKTLAGPSLRLPACILV